MKDKYDLKYNKYKQKYLELKYNNQYGGSLKEVMLFKADWCPHCNNFSSSWKEIQNKYKKKYKFITYDSDENKEKMQEYSIEGFPTIMMKNGNKLIEHQGPADLKHVIDFIENN